MIPAALAGGLVSEEDIVWRGVSVEQIGRSHSVYRLSIADEARAVLKAFTARRGETDGEIARELAVAALAKTCGAIAAITPPLLAWRGSSNIVVTQAVEGAVAWSVDRHGGGEVEPALAWSELVALLVPRLAAMHRATRKLAAPGSEPHPVLSGPVPWGLRVFDGDAPADVWQTPALGRLLGELATDRTVVSAIRAARANWRNLCLIHGDLKHDNILVRPAGSDQPVIVVDWEMARIGDPAWDLAGLAARLRLAGTGDDAWTDENFSGCAALLAAYVPASGLKAPGLIRRLVQYIGAWLVMVAVQHRSTVSEGSLDDSARPLVASAVTTLRDVNKLTAALLERVA